MPKRSRRGTSEISRGKKRSGKRTTSTTEQMTIHVKATIT
jgi:hypothetical protein